MNTHKLHNVDGKGMSKVVYLDEEIVQFIEEYRGRLSFSSAMRNILKDFIAKEKQRRIKQLQNIE